MRIIPDICTPIAPVAVLCPPWCQLPRGHDTGPDAFDQADGTRFLSHRAPVLADAGGVRLDLTQDVTVTAYGTVEAGPRLVMVDGNPDRVFTVDQARHLAAALCLAAELASGGVL